MCQSLAAVAWVLKRGIRDNAVGITAGCGLDGRGVEVRVPLGANVLSFPRRSRQVLGPTQPPVQWIAGALSPGVNRPGREADHSTPTPRSRICESIHPLPHTCNLHGVAFNYLSTGTTLPLIPYSFVNLCNPIIKCIMVLKIHLSATFYGKRVKAWSSLGNHQEI
jgi:hypothetical protein